MRVEGNERVSERLARRTFNLPVGPGFQMARGLRAFDKVDASELFDSTWLTFAPAGADVDVVLQVKDAPPNRAEVGLGYTEWERARGSIRLRHQNTLGFGEQVEVLLAASDAESVIEGSLRGDRLIVAGLGYRVTAGTNRDKPRFFSEDGDEINRARFDRDGVELALRSSLERWGLVEAGARFGRVTTSPRGGLDFAAETDQVGALFGRVVIDTLDDLPWPERGRRLAALRRVEPRRARRGEGVLAGAGRGPQGLARRPAPRGPGRRPRRRSPAETCPSTTGTAWVGSSWCRATTTRS